MYGTNHPQLIHAKLLCDDLSKTSLVCTTIELDFNKDILNNYSSPVYQILNINQSAFLESILSTLQSYDWNNGINGGH